MNVDAPSGELLARSEPLRVAQVLTNLLGNAVKYSPENSEVSVRLRVDADQINVAVTNPADDLIARFIAIFRMQDRDVLDPDARYGLNYQAISPPSITNSVPVTQAASSDAR